MVIIVEINNAKVYKYPIKQKGHPKDTLLIKTTLLKSLNISISIASN